MASPSIAASKSISEPRANHVIQTSTFSGVIVLAGRILFSFIFLMGGLNHFSKQTIGFAAAQGVPLASIAVPLSGIIAILGALSIILGYHARLGAWLFVLFLVPVTLMMHQFWGVKDPMAAQMQLVMFMKNVSIMGGALVISQLGAGPFSLDSRAGR
jgi:putative oxidoreductase